MSAPAALTPALGRAGRVQRRLEALPRATQGVLWMLLAGFSFSLMAATVKWLGANLHPSQIAFFRCAFGLVLVLPFVAHAGLPAVRTGHIRLHATRALTGILAMSAGFYALTHLPLADVASISFTKGMFMIVLAVLIIGEKVRWRRWTATAIGFLGVIIMVRPGSAGFQPVMLIALANAFLAGIVVTLIRRFPPGERPITIMFYFGLVSTPVALLPAYLFWTPVDWPELGLLALAAGFGAAGQAFAIRAHRAGEASIVAPFDYARLIYATALGFLLFGHLPDRWTLAGAAVIVLSSLYIWHREMRLGLKASGGPTPH